MSDVEGKSRTAGGQTLTRGLRILRAVVLAPNGLTVPDVADQFQIHRSIAFRVMNTLAEQALIARGPDGHFRGASGLLDLLSGVKISLTLVAQPVMRGLADNCQATISLFVQEGDKAVALSVAEPTNPTWRVGYAAGSRIPLDRGAVAYALRSLFPEVGDDPDQVRAARRDGYSRTFGEVEPGFFGLAAPIPEIGDKLPTCLCVITNRVEVVDASVKDLMAASRAVGAAMAPAATSAPPSVVGPSLEPMIPRLE